MKKLIIKQNNEVKQVAFFESDESLNDFVDILNAGLTCWGNPEQVIKVNPEEMDESLAIFETIPADFTFEIEDISAQVDQERINAEAQAYLSQTDWYVIRMMDSGVAIPNEVVQLRQQARNRIIN